MGRFLVVSLLVGVLTSLAKSFVDSIRAPRKAFVAIEDGGHFAVFMRSGAFLHELVSRVRPLAEHR